MENNIDVVIERLNNLLKENKEEHESILAQVTKTNGSVADIQKWRYILTGAIIIMNVFLVPIIIAVTISFITK